MNPLEERAVSPFYLQLMGLNGIRRASESWTDLVRVGQTLTLADTTWLLRGATWRTVVMGAWYSTKFDHPEVGDALSNSMRMSYGSLTAPPLAVALVTVTGRESLADLEEYVVRDPGQDGSAAFVAAAIEHVGPSPRDGVSDQDRQSFRDLLSVATRLRTALAG